ncbi:hypothetical protein FDB55_07380 [Clostridium botulinum]|uniref:Uncharacterized protein n=1 Tax=Clostridium botulinum TaxID=1491 RepID=A0A0C2N480_CLOBO|nr:MULTISPECIES: hypothetical protein [Clostridium]ACD52206.1 hypothetical protein CLH_2835 [Clostridium botulinum E3 str. Alaska E43]AJF30651.1 hypothetical protein ST13_13370 [Clostridium botulinum]AJF33714.1 hypothetical protein ST12_13370 [Clostridium botulinum]KAI3349389.1 hypothetical protein CIT18_08980 [Clostridium botulinum]KIL07890.1 hypothetical protein SR42_02235 [Clostridium botulinum]
MYFKFPNDFLIPVKSVSDLIEDLNTEDLRTDKDENIEEEITEEKEIKQEKESVLLNKRGLQGIDEVIKDKKFSDLLSDKCDFSNECKINHNEISEEVDRKEEISIEEGLKDIKNKKIWEEIDEEYSESQLIK